MWAPLDGSDDLLRVIARIFGRAIHPNLTPVAVGVGTE
jgi:hypothetical protein